MIKRFVSLSQTKAILNRGRVIVSPVTIAQRQYETRETIIRFEKDPNQRITMAKIIKNEIDRTETHTLNFYNHIMSRQMKVLDVTGAKFTFNRMLQSNCTPNLETYAMLLSSTLFIVNPTRALLYVEHMLDNPTIEKIPVRFAEILGMTFKADNYPEGSALFENLMQEDKKYLTKEELKSVVDQIRKEKRYYRYEGF